MKWIPHNYQLKALLFLLSNPIGALFLDPGLGKTSISLSAIKIFKYLKGYKGTLIVAPLRVCYDVWPDEIEKWDNFNNITYTILHEDNKKSIWQQSKDIYLINPEGLKWLYQELLDGLELGEPLPFNILWIDESTKFKNPLAEARFGLIKDMLPLFKRRYIMTGTPTPKSLLDLWSQIYILDKGKSLGSNFYKFRNKYFETPPYQKYNWEIKDFCEQQIQEAVAHLVLDMSAEEYLDMKEPHFNDIYISLEEDILKTYKRMEREMFIEIDNLQASADAQAQATIKCHQIANGNVYEDIPEGLDEEEEKEFRKTRKVIHVHNAKITALNNLIEELNGKPLLVGYHYKHDLSALKKLLGKNVPYIGSGVSAKATKQIISEWNKGNIPVLLGHPDSMAYGLNMQKVSNNVCFYSLTWNLEMYEQFYKRVHRQGVKNLVIVHHLIAKGTIDEAMLARLGKRAKQQVDLRKAIKEYRINNYL